MPLDPFPSVDGNVAVINRDGRAVGVVKSEDAPATLFDTDGAVPLYMPHFATCPKLPGSS